MALAATAGAQEGDPLGAGFEATAERILSLDDAALRNRQQRRPLLNKLREVRRHAEAGQCESAVSKLEHDLVPKTDGCAIAGRPDRTDWVVSCDAQSELHAQLLENVELVRDWCDPGVPFEEDVPGRELADLGVVALTLDPERADPGEPVIATATVVNAGEGAAEEVTLIWSLDGTDRDPLPLPGLEPGEEIATELPWTADAPGEHWIVARVSQGPGHPERDDADNLARAVLRVSGESDPAPDVRFDPIDFDALELTAGGSAIVPVVVHNLGYAPLVAAPIGFLIDGEPVEPLVNPGDDVIPLPLLTLAPGEEHVYELPWDEITPGRHTVSVLLDLPEGVPDRDFRRVTSWSVVVAGTTLACLPGLPGRWTSMGPRYVHRGSDGMPSGSVGRIDRIAFHSSDRRVLYVAAPSGGVWKSDDAGASWHPVGDGLPSLNVRGIALDPSAPDVVYAATLDGARETVGKGLHKSINGGATWDTFAPLSLVGGIREMVVRRTGSGAVLIYAASDKGLLRYLGTDPLDRVSDASEWRTIKSGEIFDLLVHPTDPSTVYVVVKGGTPGSGVFRTRAGTGATGDADWTAIDAGLTPGKLPTLDLFPGDPRIVYAAVVEPDGTAGGIEQRPWLAVFRSPDEGNSWPLVKFEHIGGRNNYNDFVRAHPTNPDLVYFGGVKLYKDEDIGDEQTAPARVSGVHDDMKDLRFDRLAASPDYYVLSDGGVFLCTSSPGGTDPCAHRNRDLRTTQFFDIDASANNADFMIGGTQDNGTMLYTGFAEWDSVYGGDGLFSLVAPHPTNRILYAQHQFLRDTTRCDTGDTCWWQDWHLANGRDDLDRATNGNELPRGGSWYLMNAFITVDPTDANRLLSQGPEVYATSDGGANWYPSGPTGTIDGTTVSGFVRRVAFQPGSGRWIAGNSDGQLWWSDNDGTSWHLLYQHPEIKARPQVVNMAFAPTDANVLYVLFDTVPGREHGRVVRLHLNLGDPAQPTVAAFMGAGLPLDLEPESVAGDGHDGNIAYVGTNQGGVYRWDASEPYWQAWEAYNRCLPETVEVRDLLVEPTRKELRAATWGRGAWSVITGP